MSHVCSEEKRGGEVRQVMSNLFSTEKEGEGGGRVYKGSSHMFSPHSIFKSHVHRYAKTCS